MGVKVLVAFFVVRSMSFSVKENEINILKTIGFQCEFKSQEMQVTGDARKMRFQLGVQGQYALFDKIFMEVKDIMQGKVPDLKDKLEINKKQKKLFETCLKKVNKEYFALYLLHLIQELKVGMQKSKTPKGKKRWQVEDSPALCPGFSVEGHNAFKPKYHSTEILDKESTTSCVTRYNKEETVKHVFFNNENTECNSHLVYQVLNRLWVRNPEAMFYGKMNKDYELTTNQEDWRTTLQWKLTGWTGEDKVNEVGHRIEDYINEGKEPASSNVAELRSMFQIDGGEGDVCEVEVNNKFCPSTVN